MLNTLALLLSSLGVGGALGIFAKSFLDKRQLKFSKLFDYKEGRYQALSILAWVAMHPIDSEMAKLRERRPDIKNTEDLERELQLEYHNMMIFASNEVGKSFAAFLTDKNVDSWGAVARAMKRDLYF